jgi:hypothetical protein
MRALDDDTLVACHFAEDIPPPDGVGRSAGSPAVARRRDLLARRKAAAA